MSQVMEDSHMAAATALCALPNSPMPKKLLRNNGSGAHPSPLGNSPFSLFTASLSPMYFNSQSRDGAGSLAASPLPRQTPTLTARLTPGMYTLDPDSSSLSAVMSISSPLVNNASNASFPSLASRGRNPNFLQRLKFDEESSIPFMPGTPQHSNASTTPGGRSRIRICNGEISKFPVAVVDDELSRGAIDKFPKQSSAEVLNFLGNSNAEQTDFNDAVNSLAQDFLMQDAKSGYKSTTMGKLTGKRNDIPPSFANGSDAAPPTPQSSRKKEHTGAAAMAPNSSKSVQKNKRKRSHQDGLHPSAKKPVMRDFEFDPKQEDSLFNTPSASRLLKRNTSTASLGTPTTPMEQKQNKCNCKKSKCLKLYCECFAAGLYCDGCNCNNCANNKTHEDLRDSAIKATLDRNPNAFRPKIKATPLGKDEQSAGGVHYKGCHCKKSNCLKKYCECFQAGVFCGERCKCSNCKNFSGSAALADSAHASAKRARQAINMKEQRSSNVNLNVSGRSLLQGNKPTTNMNHAKGKLLKSSQHRASKHIAGLSNVGQTAQQLSSITPNGKSLPKVVGMTPQNQIAKPNLVQTPRSGEPPGRMGATTISSINPGTKRVLNSSTQICETLGRNTGRHNPGATTAHVITKDKEYEEEVRAFGKDNVKLDKRLVVSILTYLDNSDLYNTSLVSKTLGPIAISDSLWEFPTEADIALASTANAAGLD